MLLTLAVPYATADVANPPAVVARREDDRPVAPAGFVVELFAAGLAEPRQIRLAPDGAVFVAESGAGRITVFRGEKRAVFADGLDHPFGIAFRGGDVYVAETGAVTRFRGAKRERLFDLPTGGHWTRDLAFSADGKKLFVSVGSRSNVSDEGEKRRANILVWQDGRLKVHASGLRNPVGLAIEPKTGRLWTSCNERDRLGDDLPPDFLTHVEEGAFYGWPWFYIGDHQDPRHEGKHAELRGKVTVPDVLLPAHSAPLGIAFWNGRLYAALHGSWNRSKRTGYKVVRVGKDGRSEDFLTGFARRDGKVWGRPVGVAAAADGSLLVTEDAAGTIWRVRPVRP
jgi:glucose/arabinose dehydrogenase